MPSQPKPLQHLAPDLSAGNCSGIFNDRMYPSDVHQGAIAAALMVCTNCPVKAPCLDDALTRQDPWGVWGGTTWDQRKALLNPRRRGAA